MWDEKLKFIWESGLTQTEIAAYLGVRQSTVSRIISGERRQPIYPVCIAIDRLYKKYAKKRKNGAGE